MFSIERYHDISCGHRVVGHESKCAHLHGHNYRVTFEVRPCDELDGVGRVLDFSVVKAALCQWLEDNWDHKFLAFTEDPWLRSIERAETYPEVSDMLRDSLVWVPFNPTAENMAKYLVEVVGARVLVGTGTFLHRCKVEETRKCSAIYTHEGDVA